MDTMTNTLIIVLGCIIITAMILAYLMWRYKVDLRVKTLEESINTYFLKQDGRIKDLEGRVDSLHTKVGARKI